MGKLRPNPRWLAWWLLAAVSLAVSSAQPIPLPKSPQIPQPELPPSPSGPLPQQLEERPSNIAARVLTLVGQVSVMKDSTPWALSVGDTIRPKQMVQTGADGYALFQVNDGSTFEVFPNSKVTFRNNMSWEDLVDLWIGRIKVHIEKWGGQPNKQRIHTPTAVISVRGTTFEVAHEEDDSTLVAVAEGQVLVNHRRLANENWRQVNAGEQLRVYRDQPIAKARLDKGALAEKITNGIAEAFYTILTRQPRGGGQLPGGGTGGTGGGAPLPGDTGGTPPPPPPPQPGDSGSTPPPPPPGN